MRIAVLAHVRHPIAPPFMGGMEAHSWHLSHALAARGHDVTLIASGDSAVEPGSGVTLVPSLAEHYDRAFPWHDFHGTDALNDHVDGAFERAAEIVVGGRFDVVHNNSLHRYPPRLARARRIPTVTSLHVPRFAALGRAVHDSAAPWSRFTVTSRAQVASWWPEGPPEAASVAYNGIDLAAWPFHPEGDGSAVWSGRITPNKGTHLAVEAARIAGVPLTLFGTIEHRDYFEDRVAPLLTREIRYGGHVPGAALATAMGGASVLLFTPLWDEPFGLAAVEAMALGLPVAAIDRGAAREVIGPAGAFAAAETGASLARALLDALSVPRRRARRRAERLFGLAPMIERYETLYAAAREGTDAPWPEVEYPAVALPHRYGAEPIACM